MNSDLATSAAHDFAARVFKLSADKEARLRAAYRLAFAREATAEDLRRAENYLTAADASLNSSQQDSTKRELQAWTLLCQALMTVSYTHLDVYKRQDAGRVGQNGRA